MGVAHKAQLIARHHARPHIHGRQAKLTKEQRTTKTTSPRHQVAWIDRVLSSPPTHQGFPTT